MLHNGAVRMQVPSVQYHFRNFILNHLITKEKWLPTLYRVNIKEMSCPEWSESLKALKVKLVGRAECSKVWVSSVSRFCTKIRLERFLSKHWNGKAIFWCINFKLNIFEIVLVILAVSSLPSLDHQHTTEVFRDVSIL